MIGALALTAIRQNRRFVSDSNYKKNAELKRQKMLHARIRSAESLSTLTTTWRARLAIRATQYTWESKIIMCIVYCVGTWSNSCTQNCASNSNWQLAHVINIIYSITRNILIMCSTESQEEPLIWTNNLKSETHTKLESHQYTAR